MTFLDILRFLLLLLVASAGNCFHNKSSVSLNRTRRMSHGIINEETLQMAKFMVSIRTRSVHTYYGENHFCGGVIFSPRFVLTSSHCLVSRRSRAIYPSHLLLVVAGTPNRLIYQSGISFHSEVSHIFVPDNFTLRNEQDIGLLFLKVPVPRDNDRIAIAKLPFRPVQVGTMCHVMGWGRMFKNGPISDTILQITIKIIGPQKCAQMLEIEKKDMLCGLDEDEESAQHPCSGDRGAPLMQGSVIYGIVSYLVDECDAYNLPSVYTDVFQSIGWIRRVQMANGSVCHFSLSLVYGAVVLNLLLRQMIGFISDL